MQRPVLRQADRRVRVERGRYVGVYAGRRYRASVSELGPAAASEDLQRLQAYYVYLCRRRLRLWLAAGSYDEAGVAAYVQSAVRKLVDLITPDSERVGRGPSNAVVKASLSRDYVTSDSSDSFMLGCPGHGGLGADAMVGTAVIEETSVLDIVVSLRTREWYTLVQHRVALALLYQACEHVVPLNLHFRIRLAGLPEDRSCVLGSGKGADGAADGVVLSVNSALGAS